MKFLTLTFVMTAATLVIISTSSMAEKTNIFPLEADSSCVASNCHAEMGKKKYVHTVGITPKTCNKCHALAKEGEHSFTPFPEEARTLCVQCHSADKSKPSGIKGKPPKVISKETELNLHAPFKEGRCTTCHDPHESDYYRHLKIPYPAEPYAEYTSETYKLCSNIECHKGFEKTFTEPRTLHDTMFRNGNLNLHYKHVNKRKGRTCRTCHQHHASEYPKLITSTFSFGNRTLTVEYQKTDTGGSCKTTCHRIGLYDRYDPAINALKSSPTPGEEATTEELQLIKEKDISDGKITGIPPDDKRR